MEDRNIVFPTSFFSPLCSVMSWSNTAPNSSWIFCISLIWLATLFIAFMATVHKRHSSFNGIQVIYHVTINYVNLITSSYHQGDNAPRFLGLWVSKAPLAGGDTSVPSGWVWSGMTPGWTSAAAWGCAHLRRPWNLGQIWLERPTKDEMNMFVFYLMTSWPLCMSLYSPFTRTLGTLVWLAQKAL